MSRTLSSSFTPSPLTTSVRKCSITLLTFAGPVLSSKNTKLGTWWWSPDYNCRITLKKAALINLYSKYLYSLICRRVKVHAHEARHFCKCFFFLHIRHPFRLTCLLQMLKHRKSNLCLWWTKVSEAVCKCDWHNVRSYLFSTCENFRLGVQWP